MKAMKGFTLIELLIVVGIIALLSITAIAGMIKTQDIYAFRGVVKDTTNVIREIRNSALANKQVNGKVPLQYKFTVTPADNKIKSFAYMPDGTEETFTEYELSEKYSYRTYDGETNSGDPLTFYYEPTTAKFNIDPGFEERFVAIRIYEGDEGDPNRESYILLYRGSGNAETFSSLEDAPK